MSVSKVILLGHLGSDPTHKTTANGKSFCYFSVATNKKLKSGDKLTQWHFVTAWEQTAVICEKFLKKGSQVYLEGELRYQEIVKQDGKKAQTASIVISNVQFLGGSNSPNQKDPSSMKEVSNNFESGNTMNYGEVPF